MSLHSKSIAAYLLVLMASIALAACGGSSSSSAAPGGDSTFGGGSAPGDGLTLGGGSVPGGGLTPEGGSSSGGVSATDGPATGGSSSGGNLVSAFLVRGSCTVTAGKKSTCSEFGGGISPYLYPMSIPKDACLRTPPVGTWTDGKCSTSGMKYKCYMNWGSLEQNDYYGPGDATQMDACELGTWTEF